MINQQVLLEAIESSLFLLPALPGRVEILDIPGVQCRSIAGSDPFVSLVGAARLEAEHADRTIRQVFDLFASQEKGFGWMTSPRSTPPNLNERLEKVGLEKAVELAGMALTDLCHPIPAYPEVFICKATAGDVKTSSRLLADAIGFTPEGAEATNEALLFGKGPGRASVYLAYVQETAEPVGYAASILLPDQPIVLLYCAATLESYRGRGVYTSLVACRLADACLAGAQAAVIQAVRQTSAPILQKLGFNELFGLDWYIWEPEEVQE